MNVEINRDYYLNQLIERRENGLIKIVKGLRRCGKSYLLRTIFKNYLIKNYVPKENIIEMAFDLYENIEYRNPEIFYKWITEKIADNSRCYILLDEVQLLGEFVSILNSLANKPNCDVYVTGSNAKFLSKDIATEFGGRGDEVQMYPLSFSESAYSLNDSEKMKQEIRPFLKINDSFKKIVVTSDTVKPFYTDDGIMIMNIYYFLMNPSSLDD